jgi:hypothetical protein
MACLAVWLQRLLVVVLRCTRPLEVWRWACLVLLLVRLLGCSRHLAWWGGRALLLECLLLGLRHQLLVHLA